MLCICLQFNSTAVACTDCTDVDLHPNLLFTLFEHSSLYLCSSSVINNTAAFDFGLTSHFRHHSKLGFSPLRQTFRNCRSCHLVNRIKD